MSSRDSNGLVDTDDSDEILQTALRTPERAQLQHGLNRSRTLTNRHERNTVTPLRIRDEGRSDTELEKQKHAYISGKKRKAHPLQ